MNVIVFISRIIIEELASGQTTLSKKNLGGEAGGDKFIEAGGLFPSRHIAY